MKSKIAKYENEYIKYQLELVDRLIIQLEKLDANPKKPQEWTLYTITGGQIFNIFNQIKAVKKFAKDIFNYDIKIDNKYDAYYKSVNDSIYLKGDKLVISIQNGDEKDLEQLIDIIKTNNK